MDRSTLKRLYNLCDPAEPLTPGDERYAEVDALGVRGASWTEEVAHRIELSDRPVCEFLTAPAGAGITTELHRLTSRLREGAGLLTVHIDAESVMDLQSPIDVADLLLAILGRTEQAVGEESGKSPSHMRRFSKWLSSIDAELSTMDQSTGSQLKLALGSDPAARKRMRSLVDANRSRFLAEVRDELTLLDHEARRLGRRGIAVLVDGMEKLTGTTAEWSRVLDSAERVFGRDASALALPVHVVYTLPFALLARLDRPARVLPMIALVDHAGQRRDAGFEAARQIIERRVPVPILEELFGPSHCAERVEHLIAASGGSPREIVRLLQSVIAQPSVDGSSFARLLSMEMDAPRRGISTREASWLACVHKSKTLDMASAEERRAAERMLLRGAVLPYRNGEAWFDLHPAVRGAPAVHAAIAAVVVRWD